MKALIVDDERLARKELTNLLQEYQEIETFYNNIRPTLCYFYKNRNEIFIRHGLERIDKFDVNNIFPPNNSFLDYRTKNPKKFKKGNTIYYDNPKNFKKENTISYDNATYPIEIDRVPFGYITTNTNKQTGFCSNHGRTAQWNKIKGY